VSIFGPLVTMSSDTAGRIELTINGSVREVVAGLNITQLLGELEIPPGRVAIEFNREILKKELWDGTILTAGDNLEIVHFVGGG
jgi:sulfur carrier protein